MGERMVVVGAKVGGKFLGAMAIFSVVRRDHFNPVMGSPAVSYSSRNSISVTMSAVFFRPVCVRRQNGGGGGGDKSFLGVGGGGPRRGGGVIPGQAHASPTPLSPPCVVCP